MIVALASGVCPMVGLGWGWVLSVVGRAVPGGVFSSGYELRSLSCC